MLFKEDHIAENDEEESKNSFISMKQILEDAIPHISAYCRKWHTVKSELIELIEELEKKRSVLIKAEQASLVISECREKKEELSETITLKNEELNKHQDLYRQIQESYKTRLF